MADDNTLLILTTLSSAVLGGLYYRSARLLKKQREVSDGLIKKRDALISEREKLINKLELESLKFQVSPHSLRNTLNVVKYYTETANLAVGRLTNVLDYLLYETGADEISLKDEINFLRNFHELMKIRTSELVVTKFNNAISENSVAENVMVPPMITAYFIENAYKHGELAKEGIIRIELSFDEDQFVYVIENTMREESPVQSQKGGIGLVNMKKRLDILYKDQYILNTGKLDNLYRAELRIKINHG